ncbi:hypothetical protein ebA1779 [Aromatoleum aromaticum EbN1]|uniref:Uncharacterized protein n=1 Tax=Aromatoleum aromaticum (strain DSM 19018 / LMG 30748 / EbN1) TaxID=76114 RepID=Q5P6H1_AROAE|nr:hypothetical protein ebA1779 [Aromatoleum aromaticum EbN1]
MPRAGEKKASTRLALPMRCRLLLRQHPGSEQLGFVGADLRVRRHRYRTPNARTTFLDLVGQLGDRVGLTGVFLCHVLVRRADQFLVDRMTGEAVLGLGQFSGGERRSGGQQARGNRSGNEQFHALFLIRSGVERWPDIKPATRI